MPSPFPGMDPYLEAPIHWRAFHQGYIYLLQVALNGNLPEGFYAQTEARMYVARSSNQPVYPDVGVFATARRRPSAHNGNHRIAVLEPDGAKWNAPEVVPGEEITESYVVVVDNRVNQQEIVAAVELLSPSNKQPGSEGQRQYQRKQRETKEKGVHLLEIDLLRAGAHTVAVSEELIREHGDWNYLATLYDAVNPYDAIFWRIGLRDPLPILPLPLTEDVSPVTLDLQAALNRYYDENRIVLTIDYANVPVPPLSTEDSTWADALLREKGLRG